MGTLEINGDAVRHVSSLAIKNKSTYLSKEIRKIHSTDKEIQLSLKEEIIL
jgi:hypothetical protein